MSVRVGWNPEREGERETLRSCHCCWHSFFFLVRAQCRRLLINAHLHWSLFMGFVDGEFIFDFLVGIDKNTIGSEKAILMNSMHIGRIKTIEDTSKANSPDRWLVVDHKYWIIVNDGKRIHIICVSMYYYWPVVSFICSSPQYIQHQRRSQLQLERHTVKESNWMDG